jgi:hypothetical protein
MIKAAQGASATGKREGNGSALGAATNKGSRRNSSQPTTGAGTTWRKAPTRSPAIWGWVAGSAGPAKKTMARERSTK